MHALLTISICGATQNPIWMKRENGFIRDKGALWHTGDLKLVGRCVSVMASNLSSWQKIMNQPHRANLVAFSLAGLLFCFSICNASEPDRPIWQSGFVGTPDPAPPLTLQRAFPKIGFKNPISINRLPESDRFLVLEQNHKVYSFKAKEDVEQADLLVDFSKDRPLCGNLPERDKRNIALFSITFHPKFAENRFAYICYTSTLGTEKLHVSRFTIDRNETPGLVTGSEVEILTCDGGGHQGCTLLFDKAGYLYISIGDLTEPSPPDRLETGQDISDLFASILRIDVDHPDQGRNYSIPKDNPFINLKWARPEVYAFGFRNPFRMTFDPPTGDLWVGDVGWEAWEMVYRVKSGGNYGWAIKEGPGDVKAQKQGPAPIEPPQIALGHNEAASVTGGFVYHGKQFPEFEGKYIFGDWTSRKFWAATFDAQRVTALKEIAVTRVKPICFEVDAQGELLVLDYTETDSGIYRFQRNPVADKPTDQFPRKLSQTKLFTEIATRKPSAGVTSFRLNSPMWMDGAQPEYLLAIPSKESVSFYQQPQKMFDWLNTTVRPPNGSVIAKTYTLAFDHKDPKNVKPIETQVAAKDDQGEWQYYTYRWNDNATDADLVDSAGTHRMLEIEESTGKRKLDWQFASRSQCRTCHTPWMGETLGFIEPQLRSPSQPSDSWRELFAGNWATAEASQRPLDDEHFIGLVNPADSNQPLDRRARSYLHSNCAHCHLNGGNASTVFEVQLTKPLHEGKMLSTKPMRGDFGISDAKIVSAGSPNHSVLLYRMAKAGTGHMPHIGSQLADSTGIQVLRQWIATLPSNDEHIKSLEILCGPVLKRDDEQRLDAAKALMSTLAGTIELSGALAERRVPSWLVRSIVETGMKLEDAAKRDLIEPYATGDLQVARLGATVVASELLAMKGDRTAGEKLFAAGVGQCSQCHRIANVGKEIGPDLSRIMDKLKSREKILQSILDPSAEIDEKFKSTAIVTADGQTMVGRVIARDDQHITLQDAQGKSEKLAVADIEAEKTLTVSLMPQQLLSALTAQQAADLLAYLETLK